MTVAPTSPDVDRFLPKPTEQRVESNTDEITRCPQCGSIEPWGEASWCAACGYYPAFDRTVESPEMTGDFSEEAAEHWWQAIPAWVWPLAIGSVAILLITIAGRIVLFNRPTVIAVWGGVQMCAGYGIFLIAHFGSFMAASAKDTSLGPFDMLMRPREIWRFTISKLPATSRRVYCGAWGFTAAVVANIVLGGISFSVTEDEWVEPRANKSVVGAVTDAAKAQAKKNGPMTMNEAFDQLSDDAEEIDQAGLDLAPQKPEAKERADCLIYGYTPRGADDFSRLLLATLVAGKLKHVGAIEADSISEEVRRNLLLRMRPNVASRSFVKTRMRAIWLKAKLMCRVKFRRWSYQKTLVAPEFDQMLNDISTN